METRGKAVKSSGNTRKGSERQRTTMKGGNSAHEPPMRALPPQQHRGRRRLPHRALHLPSLRVRLRCPGSSAATGVVVDQQHPMGRRSFDSAGHPPGKKTRANTCSPQQTEKRLSATHRRNCGTGAKSSIAGGAATFATGGTTSVTATSVTASVTATPARLLRAEVPLWA